MKKVLFTCLSIVLLTTACNMFKERDMDDAPTSDTTSVNAAAPTVVNTNTDSSTTKSNSATAPASNDAKKVK